MAFFRIISSLLWLSNCAVCLFKSHTLQAFKSIIPEVRAHYHYSCALLVYSAPHRNLPPEDELRLLEMKRFLALNLIQVASTHVDDFNFTTQRLNFCPHKSPLCILLSSDEAISQKLKSISSSGSLAGPSWVQFLDGDVDMGEYFSTINIPFNCKYLVVTRRRRRSRSRLGGGEEEDEAAALTEVWFLRHPGRVQTTDYGGWSPGRGTVTPSTLMYQRRRGLQGIVLNAVAMHDPPISILNEDENGALHLGGYLGDVWALLEHRINFTTKFVRNKSYGWGTKQNGSWNGMIEMILSGEVDVAIGDFTMTSDRLSVIAFTTPFKLTRYVVCIKTPSKDDGHWDDFLAPFVRKLWITVMGSLLVYALLLWSLHHLGARLGNAEAFACEDYHFKDCFHYVFSAYCQQGNDFTPHSWPCRVVYLMAYITGLTLLAAYSAALISSLADEKVVLPFNDLDGLLQDGRYTFGCIDRSAEFSLFQGSKDATMRKVFEKYLSKNTATLPKSANESIKRLCAEPNYASLLSVHELKAVDSSVCNLVALSGDVFPASLAIAVAKHSPYKGIINQHVNNLRDVGVLEALWTQWWPEQLYRPQSPWTSVTVANVRSSLVLLAAGATLALLGAWAERCCATAAAAAQPSGEGSHHESAGPGGSTSAAAAAARRPATPRHGASPRPHTCAT